MLPINLTLIVHAVSEKKIFEYYMVIYMYMYIAPGVGRQIPRVQFFSKILNLQSIWPFPASFALQMTSDNLTIAWATYVDLAIK